MGEIDSRDGIEAQAPSGLGQDAATRMSARSASPERHTPAVESPELDHGWLDDPRKPFDGDPAAHATLKDQRERQVSTTQRHRSRIRQVLRSSVGISVGGARRILA